MCNQKMRILIVVFVTCAGLASQHPTENLSKAEFVRQSKTAENEIRIFLPRLKLLENNYADDAEIQLGLGILYAKYAISKSFEEKAEQQWQRVLRIHPGNRPALATTAIRDTHFYTAKRRHLLDRLESRIRSAERRGVREFRVYRQNPYIQAPIRNGDSATPDSTQQNKSELYHYLSTEDGEFLVVRDFAVARRQLRDKLDQDLAVAFGIINQGQQHALITCSTITLELTLISNWGTRRPLSPRSDKHRRRNT